VIGIPTTTTRPVTITEVDAVYPSTDWYSKISTKKCKAENLFEHTNATNNFIQAEYCAMLTRYKSTTDCAGGDKHF